MSDYKKVKLDIASVKQQLQKKQMKLDFSVDKVFLKL
jgi:hypothetical protein